MKNYICLKGRKTELTEDQVRTLLDQTPDPRENIKGRIKLEEKAVGRIATVVDGEEFIILEQFPGWTAVLRKDLLPELSRFGDSNNYSKSNVRKILDEYAATLEEKLGAGSLLEHSVDLTSDDGLKDYGSVKAKASLLTTEQYRKHVLTLDLYKQNKWWWLATAQSTPTHNETEWVKCVSPSGLLFYNRYSIDYGGVRPFCILKSDIFVS